MRILPGSGPWHRCRRNLVLPLLLAMQIGIGKMLGASAVSTTELQ